MLKLTLESRPVTLAELRTFPVFACPIKAGFPSPAEDYPDVRIDLNQHLVKKPSSTYFIRVSGSSMIGAGIQDGSLLIVDASKEPQNGDIVVAVINDEMTLKRLKIMGKRIFLMPENEDFLPILVKEDDELTIFGVVLHSIQSH